MARVVVSFTTSPGRLQHIGPVIESICRDQTYKPTILKLYIPNIFGRTGEEYCIPQNIVDYEQVYNFKIVRVPEDKGPVTKVYYAFQEYNKSTDIIISIDDDVVYHNEFIQELVEAHKEQPNAVLGFMGNDPPVRQYVHAEHIQYGYSEKKYYEVKTLGGYRGILFNRSLLDDTFFKVVNEVNAIHQKEIQRNTLEDDTLTSMYFRVKQKCKLYVIGTKYPGHIYSPNLLEQLNFRFLESSNICNLYGNDNSERMKISYKIIDEYFKTYVVQ